MKNFFEQYKDPRWQKKRLQVMERDKFQCQSCGEERKTLNVHHTVPYKKNTNIWDYSDTELVTLCEECHEYIHTCLDFSKEYLIQLCSISCTHAELISNIITKFKYITVPDLLILDEQINNLMEKYYDAEE